MLVGIYNFKYPDYQIRRNEIYKRILSYNEIEFIELDIDDIDFWNKIKTVDLFLFRWAHIDDHHELANTILPIIENGLKIHVFPDLNTCWHFDDKVKQFYLLKAHKFPIIDSYVFWEKESALKWAESAEYPVVFKLKKGAGSTNVLLLSNYKDSKKIIKQIFGKGVPASGLKHKGNIKYKSIENFFRVNIDKFLLNKIRKIQPNTWQIGKNYVLFQKFLPNNNFDTRVTTIGNRAFAFRRFVRDDDFRASGSGKIDFNKNEIDLRLIQLALKISTELKFQSMAYDFLYNEKGEPEICEISYTFVDSVIYNCEGFWDENMIWHEGHFWPQYLQLKDLLQLENLKQPEIIDIKS